ncbi:MAG: hypothetical protein WC969_05620 [Elusimicrobiota bacterium]|jgi:hypothetical protein
MRLLLGALFLLAAPCAAQQSVDFGTAFGPDAFGARGGVERATAAPVGLALALSYDATTWLRVGISTTSPSGDLEPLVARGFYRLELCQLVRLAEGGGKTLSYLAGRREKGAALRALAGELALDFDKSYDAAREDDRRVLERLRSLQSVEPLPPPGGRP